MNKAIKYWGAWVLTRLGITDHYDARHKSVLILMYHRVNPEPDCLSLTVSPELFSQQLRFLSKHYEVISLGEAISRITSGAITGKSCVITFDDGYLDNYQVAAPLLAEFDMPATIFVTYDAIQTGHFGWGAFDRTLLTTESNALDLREFGLGLYPTGDQASREQAVITLHRLLKKRPDAEKLAVVEHVVEAYGTSPSDGRTMMNWEEVCTLAKSNLVTIGAHTISHPILSRVSPEQATYEIFEGKRLIEERIGRPVDYFAYPNGQPADISPEVVNMVREAGYGGACTLITGRNVPGDDPFYLKRVDVSTNMSTNNRGEFAPELFAAKISGLLHRR